MTHFKLDIPLAWRNTLALIQTVCPEAVLAGGALRDRFHGKKVKDLDIFVTASVSLRAQLNDVLRSNGKTILAPQAADYVAGCTEVSAVYEYGEAMGPVQVVALRESNITPDYVMSRIDFGLCRIVYDGADVYFHETFLRDVIEKTCTLYRSDCSAHFDRSMGRWDRLSEKYPEHRLVFSPEVRHLAPDHFPRPTSQPANSLWDAWINR